MHIPYIDNSGYRKWSKYTLFHRIGGPATETSSGYKIYYQKGIPHHINVPAVYWSNGRVEYWENGKRIF